MIFSSSLSFFILLLRFLIYNHYYRRGNSGKIRHRTGDFYNLNQGNRKDERRNKKRGRQETQAFFAEDFKRHKYYPDVYNINCVHIFSSPWKVNAIFVANLLLIIFVPKPLEKWVWLILAVAAAAIAIWVFLPDDNTGWRPYTFDKEITEMESRRFVPYNENAAVNYNKLLQNYDSNSFIRNSFLRRCKIQY